jgi:hypothetical protein
MILKCYVFFCAVFLQVEMNLNWFVYRAVQPHKHGQKNKKNFNVF